LNITFRLQTVTVKGNIDFRADFRAGLEGAQSGGNRRLAEVEADRRPEVVCPCCVRLSTRPVLRILFARSASNAPGRGNELINFGQGGVCRDWENQSF